MVRCHVDAKKARINIGRLKRINRICQAPVLSDFLKQARTHVPPQNGAQDGGCKPPVAGLGGCFPSKADMDLFQVLKVNENARV